MFSLLLNTISMCTYSSVIIELFAKVFAQEKCMQEGSSSSPPKPTLTTILLLTITIETKNFRCKPITMNEELLNYSQFFKQFLLDENNEREKFHFFLNSSI